MTTVPKNMKDIWGGARGNNLNLLFVKSGYVESDSTPRLEDHVKEVNFIVRGEEYGMRLQYLMDAVELGLRRT